MFHDEFDYLPKLSTALWNRLMVFEGEGDGGDGSGDGGGGGEHWTDAHPELKGNTVLGRYTTELDAHKGHLEAKAKLSDSFRLPEALDKITDEQKDELTAKVNKLRGVPDKAEDYEHIRHKDLPDIVQINEDTFKAFREFAKDRNVPQSDFQDFVDFQLNMIARQFEAHAKDNDKQNKVCIEKLDELWGKEKCKENCELIKRALRNAVNPDWQTVKEEDDKAWQEYLNTVYINKINNNPVLMELLSVAANQLQSTGKLLEGTRGGPELKEEDMTEKQIQQTHFPKSPGMND